MEEIMGIKHRSFRQLVQSLFWCDFSIKYSNQLTSSSGNHFNAHSLDIKAIQLLEAAFSAVHARTS